MDDDGQQISYLALPKGTPVHTSDGALLGTVLKVQDNAREHIFDGIVVKTPDGNVFVDAPEVVRITERRVTLSIDAARRATCPSLPACAAPWRRAPSAPGGAGSAGSAASRGAGDPTRRGVSSQTRPAAPPPGFTGDDCGQDC